jgi:predicted RNase H-like nuclease (RuvC/YqgF family)
VSDTREVNARLREMVALMGEQGTARDNLISLQAEQLAGQREMIKNQRELIKNQDLLIDGLTAELEQTRRLVEPLEAELARLRAQAGKDSTNSSAPPSKDSIAAKAQAESRS